MGGFDWVLVVLVGGVGGFFGLYFFCGRIFVGGMVEYCWVMGVFVVVDYGVVLFWFLD